MVYETQLANRYVLCIGIWDESFLSSADFGLHDHFDLITVCIAASLLLFCYSTTSCPYTGRAMHFWAKIGGTWFMCAQFELM
jgi:hypothetical protein